MRVFYPSDFPVPRPEASSTYKAVKTTRPVREQARAEGGGTNRSREYFRLHQRRPGNEGREVVPQQACDQLDRARWEHFNCLRWNAPAERSVQRAVKSRFHFFAVSPPGRCDANVRSIFYL